MGRPAIQSFSPTPNLDVYECHPDGERPFKHWQLWDDRAEYNIVMDAKTKEEALVEAIDYWAERFLKLQQENNELQAKVNSFVAAVCPEEEDRECD
jgi:hypothetical protein